MQSGMHLETFNLSMDVLLIGLSIWMAITAHSMKMGGAMGKTINLVVAGAIVLGLAHLTETLLDKWLQLPTDQNELIHRVIIMVGFALLTLGLRSLGQSLGKLRSKPVK